MQYQLLPDLTESEYESLKAHIAEHGVLVPVEYDEDGNILDGHHRLRACVELGITDWPSIIRPGLTEDEKRDHVLALNLERRHLTREQRRDELADCITAQMPPPPNPLEDDGWEVIQPPPQPERRPTLFD